MAKLSSKGCVGLRREESCTFAKRHFPLPALLLQSSGEGGLEQGTR